MTYIITGDVPSKKNSRNIFSRQGKIFNIPNRKHQEWHEYAMWQLRQFSKNRTPIYNIASIQITFYPSHKRKSDLSNKAESVMDLLVDAGVIEDDNWFEVPALLLGFGGVDKENPRCEIVINNNHP